MEAQLFETILAGGSGATLAAVLVAWWRCEKNHKALRDLIARMIDKQRKE